MTEHIDVREYLPKIEDEKRMFVINKKHNREAAGYRYSVVKNLSDEWFSNINSVRANAKDIPNDLIDMYEEAYEMMIRISIYERDILTGVVE